MQPYVYEGCACNNSCGMDRCTVLDIKLDKLDHCYLLGQLWYRATYTPSGVPLVKYKISKEWETWSGGLCHIKICVHVGRYIIQFMYNWFNWCTLNLNQNIFEQKTDFEMLSMLYQCCQ